MTQPTDDRFVAHFDMLGMSALTKRDPDLAWEKLWELANAEDRRLNMGIERLDTKELVKDQILGFFFSDTLVAFSKGSTANDAFALCLLTTEVFSLALHKCVPLRGGIAHGRFRFDLQRNLFSGPALIDAHALGESSQWLGIVVDNRTADILKTTPLRAGKEDGIVRWPVPMKNGETVECNVVNWIVGRRHTHKGPLVLTTEIFYQPFEHLFGPLAALSEEVRRKYENTVNFFNAKWNVENVR